MRDIKRIAEELFDKIHSRFGNTSIGDENAKSTDEPTNARFFNFDYVDNSGQNFGNVTVSIIDGETLKVYFGKSLSNEMDQAQRESWYGFLRELRNFSKRNLMQFDARDITRSNLIKKDVEQASVIEKPVQAKDVNLGESLLMGNERTSFQNIGPIKLVIKHVRPVNPEQVGSRSRYIKNIFFQNDQGERYKSPYNSLTISRALANHLAQGGQINDDNYKNICNLAGAMSKIKSFVRRSNYENYDDPEIVALVHEAKAEFREGRKLFKKLSSTHNYTQALNELNEKLAESAPEESVDYLRKKFTRPMINSKIEQALPDISAIYHRKNKKTKVLIDGKKWLFDRKLIHQVAENMAVYDDVVKYSNLNQMVERVLENLANVLTEQNKSTEAAECKGWMENYSNLENLTEKQLISRFVVEVLRKAKSLRSNEQIVEDIDDEDELAELQDILDTPIEFGVDGDNIIAAISKIISDDNLHELLYKESKDNPDEDARPIIKYWLLDNNPELHDQLDFSKLEDKNVVPDETAPPVLPPPPPPPPPPPVIPPEAGTTPAMEPQMAQIAQLPQPLPQPLPQELLPQQALQELKKLSGIR